MGLTKKVVSALINTELTNEELEDAYIELHMSPRAGANHVEEARNIRVLDSDVIVEISEEE